MASADPLVLTAGDARVTVAPAAGGRLSSLVVAGRERLLRAPPPGQPTPETRWGCFLMAPWAGRVGGAALQVDGERVSLPAREPPHALHGTVVDAGWDVERRLEQALSLVTGLHWPLGGQARQTVRLQRDGLALTAEVRATTRRMPVWLGWHPWFARPPDGDLAVRLDAAEVAELGDDLLPTGRRLPVAGDTDLRAGGPLRGRLLDHVYPDVSWPAEVVWPDLALRIDAAAVVTTAVVHTPPAGVCVEPQTGWPDAAALQRRGLEASGCRWLNPGESLHATTTWTWR